VFERGVQGTTTPLVRLSCRAGAIEPVAEAVLDVFEHLRVDQVDHRPVRRRQPVVGGFQLRRRFLASVHGHDAPPEREPEIRVLGDAQGHVDPASEPLGDDARDQAVGVGEVEPHPVGVRLRFGPPVVAEAETPPVQRAAGLRAVSA
jgi:hypothetical protein